MCPSIRKRQKTGKILKKIFQVDKPNLSFSTMMTDKSETLKKIFSQAHLSLEICSWGGGKDRGLSGRALASLKAQTSVAFGAGGTQLGPRTCARGQEPGAQGRTWRPRPEQPQPRGLRRSGRGPGITARPASRGCGAERGVPAVGSRRGPYSGAAHLLPSSWAARPQAATERVPGVKPKARAHRVRRGNLTARGRSWANLRRHSMALERGGSSCKTPALHT